MFTSTLMTRIARTGRPIASFWPAFPKDRIRDRDAYSFFVGLGADGGPTWTPT